MPINKQINVPSLRHMSLYNNVSVYFPSPRLAVAIWGQFLIKKILEIYKCFTLLTNKY